MSITVGYGRPFPLLIWVDGPFGNILWSFAVVSFAVADFSAIQAKDNVLSAVMQMTNYYIPHQSGVGERQGETYVH